MLDLVYSRLQMVRVSPVSPSFLPFFPSSLLLREDYTTIVQCRILCWVSSLLLRKWVGVIDERLIKIEYKKIGEQLNSPFRVRGWNCATAAIMRRQKEVCLHSYTEKHAHSLCANIDQEIIDQPVASIAPVWAAVRSNILNWLEREERNWCGQMPLFFISAVFSLFSTRTLPLISCHWNATPMSNILMV